MNQGKTLLMLGGLRYLKPAIAAAQRLGIRVVTLDNVPSNPAHRWSDVSVDASVTDASAIFDAAVRHDIDGITSFAVNPGVITASVVAHLLNLPFPCQPRSACAMQDKGLFRSLLDFSGFHTPRHLSFGDDDDILGILSSEMPLGWPVIVKPIDSAGSKGVSLVDNIESLSEALLKAFPESPTGRVIVEEYIHADGYPSDSEAFFVNGRLLFCSFSDQYFDSDAENTFVPSGFLWPSSMPENRQLELMAELQRLADILQIDTGLFNVETRFSSDGRPYIMELSPRGGGNRLAEMLDMVCGSSLIENSVRASVGMPLLPMEMPVYDGALAEVIIHSCSGGRFHSLEIAPHMRPLIVETDLWVKPGSHVRAFNGANNAIGTLVLRSHDREILKNAMENPGEWLKIIVD